MRKQRNFVGRRAPAVAGVALAFLVLLPGAGVCGRTSAPDATKADEAAMEETLHAHTKELLALPGLVGTAMGRCDGAPCIKVFVEQRTPKLDRKIFDALSGQKVDIIPIGKIRALPVEGK